jgi:hypothetical protein
MLHKNRATEFCAPRRQVPVTDITGLRSVLSPNLADKPSTPTSSSTKTSAGSALLGSADTFKVGGWFVGPEGQ